MNINKNLGMLLLGLWLILTGLAAFVPGLAGLGTIMSIVALLAGLLIVIGR